MTLEEMMKDINRNAEDWLNAGDVAAAINRGTDEYGRPSLLPFDPTNMVSIGDPRVSTSDQGLSVGRAEPRPMLVLPRPLQIDGQLAENMRPSNMIEDRRTSISNQPSMLMDRDWLTSALDEAVRPNPEADNEFSQELTRNKNLPGRSSR
jgi:hypothetical protein